MIVARRSPQPTAALCKGFIGGQAWNDVFYPIFALVRRKEPRAFFVIFQGSQRSIARVSRACLLAFVAAPDSSHEISRRRSHVGPCPAGARGKRADHGTGARGEVILVGGAARGFLTRELLHRAVSQRALAGVNTRMTTPTSTCYFCAPGHASVERFEWRLRACSPIERRLHRAGAAVAARQRVACARSLFSLFLTQLGGRFCFFFFSIDLSRRSRKM